MPELLKTCKKCQEDKPLVLFVKSKRSLHGRGSWCLTCFSGYISERGRVRQSILNEVKSKPCLDCSRRFPPHCMDLDHVRGTKVRDVSSLLTSSLDRFWEEVNKCEVVCACCHRIRSKPTRNLVDPRYIEFQLKLSVIKDKPCLDCGLSFPPCAMDFDHVRDTKVRDISQMSLSPWPKVIEEISKCDLVCACCHRIRTRFSVTTPTGEVFHA